MAFSYGNGSGGYGRGRFRGVSTLSEINIVPLVDVVLVLLIIFMLTAHVMDFGLEVDVPKVKETQETTKELPVVTLTKDGESSLNGKPVPLYALGDEIHKRFADSKGVYVRADKSTTYDPIAQVISTLHQANLAVNLVTQPIDEGSRRR